MRSRDAVGLVALLALLSLDLVLDIFRSDAGAGVEDSIQEAILAELAADL